MAGAAKSHRCHHVRTPAQGGKAGNHWQVQFERINHALMGFARFNAITDAVEAVEGRPDGDGGRKADQEQQSAQ